MRFWVAFLIVGFGLTMLTPVLGALMMLTGAVRLAIVLENDLQPPRVEPAIPPPRLGSLR